MTDRTDHRAAAERLLADANEWGRQAEEPTPEVGELACLAYAAVHALLAIHDTLTAADRYAANEAKQREAEPDPLDEDDHRDRVDADGDIWVREPGGCWHVPFILGDCCALDCEWTLAYLDERYGPLAFVPGATRDATGGDLSAPEGESGAEGRGEAEDAAEPLLCPECGDAGDSIDEHNARGCRYVMCGCQLSPSDIARALIERAVADERTRLAQEVRQMVPRMRYSHDQSRLQRMADAWEAGTNG